MDGFDGYYIGKACEWWDYRNPAEFYYNLTEEMIDNCCTERRTQINQAGQPVEYPGHIRNILPRCTPTNNNRKRKTPNRLVDTEFLAQSRCKVCRGKTTYVCNSCGNYLCYEKSIHFCLNKRCE